MATKKSQAGKKLDAVEAKKSMVVANQVVLDPVNPVPFEGGQAFTLFDGIRYSPFLYPNDNFAQILLEAKLLSATHSACIESKKTYCAGQGLYDVKRKDFAEEVRTWLRRINAKGDGQLSLNRKAFGSLFTFGNIPVELVRLTVGKTRRLFVYVHNVLEWRLGLPDKKGFIREAIQSRQFTAKGFVRGEDLDNSLHLPLYDPDQRDSKNWKAFPGGVERTMLWIKNDMDGYTTYGMPSSVASLIYQVLEYKAARYNLDNFENNMVIGGLLSIVGNLDQPEVNRIARAIINAHSGDGKRGRVAVVASEQKVESSDFTPFTTQKEGSFTESDTKVMEKIVLANEWSALLANLPQAGALGKGNGYLKAEYKIKKATVIDPAQEFLIAQLWEPVFQIAQEWLGGSFGGYELGIRDIDPISALGDIDPTGAVTIDEVRESINLPALGGEIGSRLLNAKQPAPAKDGENQGGENV